MFLSMTHILGVHSSKLSFFHLCVHQKIPATSEYRVNVEKWFSFISKSCTEKNDIKAIEDEISLGQIEEVIEMAKDELTLIDYYHGSCFSSIL